MTTYVLVAQPCFNVGTGTVPFQFRFKPVKHTLWIQDEIEAATSSVRLTQQSLNIDALCIYMLDMVYFRKVDQIDKQLLVCSM